MRLDRLPVGEAIVGFLLVALVVTFVFAREEIQGGEAEVPSGSPTATGGPTGTTPAGGLEITMTDNKFDPTELTAPADEETVVNLKNEGAAIHNVHIADASGNYPANFCTAGGPTPCSDPTRIAGGQSGTITFTLSAGEYPFRCDYHPTEMKGTLTVQ
jgi:plastocyanin